MFLVLALLALTAAASPPDDPAERKRLGDAARARRDYALAERHYRQAAQAGNLDAAVALGDVLMRDVKAGANEAAQWYLHAFGQGRTDVFLQLGRCYDHGWGVKRELIEAYKWYSLLPTNHPFATKRLAELRQTMTPGQVQEAERRATALRR